MAGFAPASQTSSFRDGDARVNPRLNVGDTDEGASAVQKAFSLKISRSTVMATILRSKRIDQLSI